MYGERLVSFSAARTHIKHCCSYSRPVKEWTALNKDMSSTAAHVLLSRTWDRFHFYIYSRGN